MNGKQPARKRERKFHSNHEDTAPISALTAAAGDGDRAPLLRVVFRRAGAASVQMTPAPMACATSEQAATPITTIFSPVGEWSPCIDHKQSIRKKPGHHEQREIVKGAYVAAGQRMADEERLVESRHREQQPVRLRAGGAPRDSARHEQQRDDDGKSHDQRAAVHLRRFSPQGQPKTNEKSPGNHGELRWKFSEIAPSGPRRP